MWCRDGGRVDKREGGGCRPLGWVGRAMGVVREIQLLWAYRVTLPSHQRRDSKTNNSSSYFYK